MNLQENYTKLIKNKSKELGFFFCGISKADFLSEEAPLLENWLSNNRTEMISGYVNNYKFKILNL